MRKVLVFTLVIVFLMASSVAFAGGGPTQCKSTGKAATTTTTGTDDGYGCNMKKAYGRGCKNIVMSPAEVVIGVKDQHGKGVPVLNYIYGAGVGVLKGLQRLGSGCWDLVAGLIPGHQEGMPVDPETLA